MKIRGNVVTAAIVFGVAAICGCGPSEEGKAPQEGSDVSLPTSEASPPAADADAALVDWQSCVAAAEARMGDPKCKQLAATLAGIGGPPLEQALSQLDDDTTSPHGKVMIVEGFNGRLNSHASNILKAMTAKDKDETTRACATALLSSIPDVNLVEFLIPLTSDANVQVKFSALLGVASAAQEDSEFRKQLAGMYALPETNANMKEHIAGVFNRTPYKADEPILIEVVKDSSLSVDVRRDAAIALGRVGDQGALDALMSIDQPKVPTPFSDAVDLGIAAIKGRIAANTGAEENVEMKVTLPPTEETTAP